MDIKVIVATHKQYRMPSDNCYMPLHVGKQGKVDLGYLGDDSGDSISEKNGHYCFKKLVLTILRIKEYNV